MNLDQAIQKAKTLIENSKNPIVFFDTDTDGSMSFIQLKRSFKNIKIGFALGKDEDSQKECQNQIMDDNDLIIFFDTPYIEEQFFQIIGNRNVLWVDHHVQTNSQILNQNENIFFLNPLNFDQTDSRCSAFWAYKISNDKTNLPYVAIASVADYYLLDIVIDLFEYDKNSFNTIFKISEKKRSELFNFINQNKFNDDSSKEKRDYWIKYLWYEAGLIQFKMFFDIIFKIGKSDQTSKLLNQITKLDLSEFKMEISEGKTGLFEKFSQINQEYKKVYKKITKNLENKNGLIYAEHDNTSISFNRQISEELSYRCSDYEVIFSAYHKDSKNFYSCSFRSKTFDVNNLIQTSSVGLKVRGGGHKRAAGAIASKKDFQEFKKRIFEKFN